MNSNAQLAHWALTLELASLTDALKPGVSVDGLLLAAASAHDPEPRLQEAVNRLLLRHGANVNESTNGVTPRHRAVRFRSPTAVKLLLEHGMVHKVPMARPFCRQPQRIALTPPPAR
jgi:uncharacterized protein